MRDRRNTHLSSASTSSCSSTDSITSTSGRSSLNEKDLEQQRPASNILDDAYKGIHTPRPSRRYLFYRIASLLSILFYVGYHLQHDISAHRTSSQASSQPITFDRKQPAAVALTDQEGRDRWSVYIPESMTFPLPAQDYERICRDAERLESKHSPSLWQSLSWWHRPSISYMDVDEAKSLALLPSITNSTPIDVCDSSLTFIMDRSEASFGKTLLLFWLSYGLAKREQRAFFLDDSQWVYGSYSSYFPPLPRPGCNRPPPSHIVPRPLEAKHLVVTAVTAASLLHDIVHHGTNKKMSIGSGTGPVFDLMRAGYTSTFKLIGEDAVYAQQRLDQLRDSAAGQSLVGMHLRRGDLHPFELQFSQDYLPVERYTDAAKKLLGSAATPHTLVLASDDPDLTDSPELTLAAAPHRLQKSQERIQLATKLALDQSMPAKPVHVSGSAYTKHVDENAGWDGGFFTALFYSLGDSRSRKDRLRSNPPASVSKETMRMRELVGRGYLLDLAVLSRMDGIVCAVSSAACRALAVMMGEEAMDNQHWVNVDDKRHWSWDGRK